MHPDKVFYSFLVLCELRLLSGWNRRVWLNKTFRRFGQLKKFYPKMAFLTGIPERG